MRYTVVLFLLFSLFFLGTGCRKEGVSRLDCDGLRQAILADDVEKVRTSIAGLLGVYSEENIYTLAAAISNQCAITATVDCFECIKTLPPQTEITLSFSHNGNLVQKRLDISVSSANRIILVGMHN